MNKRLISLSLIVIPLAFTVVACSADNQKTFGQRISLASKYDGYNSTIEIYEGYLPFEKWNWKIKAKEELVELKQIILENYTLENMNQQKLEIEEKEKILLPKEEISQWWEKVIQKYDDIFFEENYLIINPEKTFNDREKSDWNVYPEGNINTGWSTYGDLEYKSNSLYALLGREYYAFSDIEYIDVPKKSITKTLLNDNNNVVDIYPEGGKWYSEVIAPYHGWVRYRPRLKISGVQFTIIPKKYENKEYKFHTTYSFEKFYSNFVEPKTEDKK